MENVNQNLPAGNYNDDPFEDLHIQNEILELTIRAELGGEMVPGEAACPEVRNRFLRNIIGFEQAYQAASCISIFSILNRPAVKKAVDLDDEEITVELDKLQTLLFEKGIVVEYRKNYTNRLKYKFLSEELLQFETEDIRLPGLQTHFSYENFHPNHAVDIEDCASEFLQAWMSSADWTNDCHPFLSASIILPDGRIVPVSHIINRINEVRNAPLAEFRCSYQIDRVNYELLQESALWLGHAEGMIGPRNSKAETNNPGNSGRFKLFMCLEDDHWKIIYFVFPGFSWE